MNRRHCVMALVVGSILTVGCAETWSQSTAQRRAQMQERRREMQRQNMQRGNRPSGGRQREARGGGLQVGEVAPNFVLKSLDGKSETDLSELNAKPVVLFFGSYT